MSSYMCQGSASSKGFTLFKGMATYKEATQGQYVTQCKTLTAVEFGTLEASSRFVIKCLQGQEEAYAKCRIYANTKKIRSGIYDVGKRYFQNKVVLGA